MSNATLGDDFRMALGTVVEVGAFDVDKRADVLMSVMLEVSK